MKKKNILLFILPSLLFLMVSCEKFLDKKPLASITSAGFYNTAKNASEAVNAIYDIWTAERFPHLLYAQGDCASDDSEVGGNPTVDDQPDAQQIMLYKTLSNNIYITKFANMCYTGIQRANNVLYNTDQSTNSQLTYDPSSIRGEASFLRATFYYYLATTMGPVPLITEPLTQDKFTTGNREANDDEKGSKHLEKIYNQIIKDLEYAASVLPTHSASPNGRATKASAYGYLIKTYAIMATSKYVFPDKTGYWDKVIEYSDKIRAEDPRTLTADYHKLFTVAGENSSESLFEIQFLPGQSDNGANGEGTIQVIDFAPRSVFGITGNFGYGCNTPTIDLVKQFDINTGTVIKNWDDTWVLKATPLPTDSSSGDKLLIYLKNQIKRYAPKLMKNYADYDPRLDLIGKPGDSVRYRGDGKWYQLKAFKGNFDNSISGTGFWDMKTGSSLLQTNSDQFNDLNKILLRYADVLLLEAEARFQKGDVSKATDLVNQIRARARNSRYVQDTTNKKGVDGYIYGYKIVPGTTPADIPTVNLDDIKKERRRELFLEGVRFYDLVRWNGDGSQTNANTICPNRPTEFHQRSYSWRNDQTIFVPIPSILIEDGKGNVIQNTGY